MKYVWAEVKHPVWWMHGDKAVSFGPCPLTKRIILPRSLIREYEYQVGGDSKELRHGEHVVSVCIPAWLAHKKDMRTLD